MSPFIIYINGYIMSKHNSHREAIVINNSRRPCTTFTKSPCPKLLALCKESSAKILMALYKEHRLVGILAGKMTGEMGGKMAEKWLEK